MKEILIPLNFTTTPTVTDTKQSFSTSDEASGVLTFTTTVDVTGTVASLTIRNASENANRQTVLIERLDINRSPFSYTLKTPLPYGQYEGTVLLKKNLTVIASATFLFGVNRSLSAEVLPDLVKAYSLDELVENVETEVSNLKDAFTLTVSETVKGVNKTENTLQAQENVRYLNEHTRKTNEESRIANEQARIVAELERKDTFDTLVDSAVIEQTVVQEVAEKYQEIEALNAPEMVSFRQQLEQTQADLQAGIGAVTADAEVVTARNSTVKGKTFTVLDGRLEEIESDAIALKKLVLADEPMRYDKVLGEYVNVGKYWDAYRDGNIYTTEFNNYEVSPSPTGTKKDANAGLVAVPSTNLVAGQDDYANIGLFKPVEVNAYVDANDDYHITAIKGDGRFKRDGTNGDVYIMNMLGYVKRFDTPTTWGYSYSDTLYAGFNVLPEAVKPDGTVRPFLLHAKYIAGVGSDGKLASISGVNPEFNSMSHDGQITKFKEKGEQYSGKTTHDDFWMKLMLFLKYATTNSEAVMRGCISYYLQYQPSVYESGVSRVVLTNAQANALVVGSRVSIGNYAGFTKTDDRASALVHNVANRVKITSITALPDGLNSAVNVDAPAFDTNATTTITTVPWGSGACDNVLGNDGSPISNTSGKEPLVINGIETMVGGYEVIQNLMIYNDNTNPLDYKIKVYACYDSKLYKAGSPSADYKLLSVLMVQTNNTWKYISKLGVDPNHPTALIPVAATASSTTGFADGIYTNAPTTGYRVWLSLGILYSGSLCGFFYVLGIHGLGISGWYVLGRLSATGRSLG